MNKICLGTANIGTPYGINNRKSDPSNSDLNEILLEAHTLGVDFIDTAISYEKSEEMLGQCSSKNFKIISKLPAVPTHIDIKAWVWNEVESSLKRLGQPQLYGLLLHNPADLLGDHGADLAQILADVKASGLVNKVGISIYHYSELDRLFPIFEIDIVQAPFNIFDRGISNSGWLEKLADSGIEFHARSIFLQGVLFLEPHALPNYFWKWATEFKNLQDWLTETNQNIVDASVKHILSYDEVSLIIAGFSSFSQIKNTIIASEKLACRAPSSLQSTDSHLTNPQKWDFQDL